MDMDMDMKKRLIIIFLLASVLTGGALTGCMKAKKVKAAVIAGSDTIVVSQLAALDPSGSNDSVRARNIAMRVACAGGIGGAKNDSVINILKERLLLVSGVEWNNVSADLLLKAAERLNRRVEEAEDRSCTSIIIIADSLKRLAMNSIVKPFTSDRWTSFACDTADILRTGGKAGFAAWALGVSWEVAELIVEFTEKTPQKKSSVALEEVKEMVSGLVSSPSVFEKGNKKIRAGKSGGSEDRRIDLKSDNSMEALRYRSYQSILDSIHEHIPNLRELYKKHLKTNPSMAGKVVLTFRVEAAGSVAGAEIKTSDISNKEFLEPLLSYVRTMRFKPIPEKIGLMSFDFPFEFYPEM